MKTSTKTSILEDSFYGGVHRGVPIAGYEEFVLPVIEKVLASSRHLSVTSLARFANRVRPGHHHRGCSKVHCAAAIAAALCKGSRELGYVGAADGVYLDKFCRDLRFASNGYSRQNRTLGEPSPVEADRDHIVSRLAGIESELAKPVEPPSSYHGQNYVAKLKNERYELTRALAALGEGVGNYTLKLDSKQKFYAVLDALTQYVDHGEHGSQSQLDAGKSLLEELETVLG
jgi:hypothetical protein